ncbi:porin [Candidatus Marithrix sp. Canyon 246]|nr:porin [Candidatus Marithrix sp. Canyon 246]
MQKKTLKALALCLIIVATNASAISELKFNGVHYLGFTSSKEDGGDRESNFETRRNYFQVKAYFNKKDYMRLTLDSFQETKGSNKDKGSWLTRVKYAYLYLDEVLPYTGVEMGQVHRPWIDYEEHHGWWFRSISKVFVESGYGAHLINSADLGVNFKTKLAHFSSEIGVYNGEGYHAIENGEGLSTEARLTYHVYDSSKGRKPSNDYINFSYFGIKSLEDNKRGNNDFTLNGLHAVYNTKQFLIAGQYIKADNGNNDVYEGDGYSLNFEYRPMDKFWFIGRYDDWDQAVASNGGGDRKHYLLGAVYNLYKQVRFIANVRQTDYDESDSLNAGIKDETQFMLTAEVHW